MLPALLVLAALPWLLLVACAFYRRRFAVLLIWLLVAPAVTYLIQQSDEVVLFQTEGTEWKPWESNYYYEQPATLTWQKLLAPTRMVFGALFLIFLLDDLLRKRRSIPLDTTEIRMGIFSIILLANVFLWSKRLVFGLHVAVDAFIMPFLGYYLTRRLVTTEERFHQLVRVIGYMGVYVIIFSLVDRFTTADLFYRLQGPFSNRDHLYVTMAVVFFVVFLDLFSNRDPAAKKGALPRSISWFVITLAPVIVLLTLTRGNWLGFVAGVSLMLFLVRRWVNFSTQLASLGLAMMLGVVVVVSPPFVPQELLEERVADVDNIQGRLATWIATLEVYTKAPVLGIGLNNLMGELSGTVASIGETSNYTTAHNSYLTLLSELGLTGVVLFVTIQVSIIQMGINLYRVGRRFDDRWRGATVVALMVSYIVPSLFEHLVVHATIVHVYVYVFIGAIAGLYRNRRPVCDSSGSPGYHWATGRPMSAVRAA
jgi:O-Antigen ligase